MKAALDLHQNRVCVSNATRSDLHVVLLADDLPVGPGQTGTDCRNRLADPLAPSIVHHHVEAEGEHLVVLREMKRGPSWFMVDTWCGTMDFTWLWVKQEKYEALKVVKPSILKVLMV